MIVNIHFDISNIKRYGMYFKNQKRIFYNIHLKYKKKLFLLQAIYKREVS